MNRESSKIWEIFKDLILVAQGVKKATVVIKDTKLVNVHSKEILEGWDIAIYRDRIAYIGEDADHTIGGETQVYNARGRYAIPGLIDPHIHIESSMTTVTEFSRMVIPRGTTTVFIDNHEIANVLGLKGVKLMMDEARYTPLRVYLTVPSCVPASNASIETSGAELTPEDISEALSWSETIALGEMMNFPGVLKLDEKVVKELEAAHRINKVVEGHDPMLMDKELNAYLAAGISSTHESTTKEEVIERIRRGMYVYCREGSAWLDIKETVKAITEARLDPRHICLATDDREADSIVNIGHMDNAVKRAIEEGVDPITAIQMATLNPAEHYRLSNDIGSIAPARYADIVLLRDLTKVEVDTVFIGGDLVAKEGVLTIDIPRYKYPEWALDTINIKRRFEAEDFYISYEGGDRYVNVRVIQAIEGKILTREVVRDVEVIEGNLVSDPDRMIYKAAVIERYTGFGGYSLGFIEGFGWRRGAIASTVAHDSHNIIVLGVDEEDMAKAVNHIIDLKGGVVTVVDGEVVSEVSLPIAGLMSDKPYNKVANDIMEMYSIWRQLGCKWVSPFMTLSMLALVVIPEIRLSDKGLYSVSRQRFVNLILDGEG
ncbi:MAG TPA: adenine deaminase [Thermoprotei archaeon]|nr:adenine deaminase [Thermoprotei archaeon]